jgi:superfamily II DNA or RNA helicase
VSTLFDETQETTRAISLRPYQEEAKLAIHTAFETFDRALIQLPTGCGKTIVFAATAHEMGYPVLVIAHRDELLDQAAEKFRMWDPGVTVGKVKAESDQWWTEVVVASIQTLWRPKRLEKLRRVLRQRPFKLAVVDEAHHAPADSYQKVLAVLHEFDVPVLGVTATPERGTGGGLEGVWPTLAYQYPILRAIQDGYLSDVRGLRVELKEANLDRLKVNRGDWQDGQMAEMLHDAGAPGYAVKAYLEHAPDRKGIVFTPTVDLAYEMAAAFNDAGVPAAAINGNTPRTERQKVYRALREGTLRIVANASVLTEGFDEPSVDLVVIARPTLSRVLYVQMVGRAMRLFPGKTDCLVMDLVGVTEKHKLQSVANLFGVREEMMQRGMSAAEAVAVQEAQDAEEHAEQKRLAEIEAQVIDLFTQQRLNWMKLHPELWVLRGQQGQLELRAQGDGTWSAAYNPDDKRRHQYNVLDTGVPLEVAQGLAEDYVRRAGAEHLVDRNAPWRSKPVMRGQMAALAKWGVDGDRIATLATAGEASDLLSEMIARSRAKGVKA